MSEIVVVGSGISAAAACAVLKKKYKITVFEQRPHIGGNCRDYLSRGTLVHQYGAHIYHNPNKELHAWLSKYTDWIPYKHAVTAEIAFEGYLAKVPFPYSQDTEKVLGWALTDPEILAMFFKGYSSKMWGTAWGDLPASIKNRVPKRQEHSDFFPGQITALPRLGYSHLIENMFEGCDVILGADLRAWEEPARQAKHVIYCGRLDRLQTRLGLYLGSEFVDRQSLTAAWLDHVTLKFEWGTGHPEAPTAVLNYCHTGHPAIRRIQHAQLTGGDSEIFHTETPVHTNSRSDPTPIYPDPRQDSGPIVAYLKKRAREEYPNLIPLGRVASHQYLDIHQAVGAGRALGESLLL